MKAAFLYRDPEVDVTVHTLSIYEPGHFHAALTLRVANPRVAQDVHVYAQAGPELDAFVALIQSFNEREDDPTDWRLHVHDGPDPLARLVADRPGDIAVLAGRNRGKLAAIRELCEAGFNVFADKPWITDDTSGPDLEAVTRADANGLCMDIMTERFDTVAMLRKALLGPDRLLGAPLLAERGTAFEIGSIHHLYKMVNGRPLRRPAWYYDVTVQGDGLVDIQTHMADQAQWLLAEGQSLDLASDYEIESAQRWATEVSPELFADSTGLDTFPAALSGAVHEGNLALMCNGEIAYQLNGCRVVQRAEWGQREPEGSGDLHRAVVRGEQASLSVDHNAIAGHEPAIVVSPASGVNSAALGDAVERAVGRLQARFPGLSATTADQGAWRLQLPAAIRTSHESHFAMALEEFLDFVDSGAAPPDLRARIRARHGLLAAAYGRAGA